MKPIAWLVAAAGVVCSVVYVVTGVSGDDGTDWLNGWLIGPILLFTVVPGLFSIGNAFPGFGDLSGRVPRSLVAAPIGMGTVVSAQRTGVSVNDQPQLEIVVDVTGSDGETFRGSFTRIIDITELAAVAPGACIPVRYRSDTREVALASDAAPQELQHALNLVQVAKGHLTPQQLRIAQEGHATQAVVLAMTPTGEVRGDRSVLDLRLRVRRPDGTTFDLDQRKAVPPSGIAQVQPGMVVTVQYLPDDESQLTIATRFAG